MARALCIPNATSSSPPIPFASRHPTRSHDHPPRALYLAFSLFLFFNLLHSPLATLYHLWICLLRCTATTWCKKRKNSARVWPTRHRHVLSRWINVNRVRAVAHPLISIQLDRRTLFGLFDNVTCLATRFAWPAEYSWEVGEWLDEVERIEIDSIFPL